jgi:hypothetical protein
LSALAPTNCFVDVIDFKPDAPATNNFNSVSAGTINAQFVHRIREKLLG